MSDAPKRNQFTTKVVAAQFQEARWSREPDKGHPRPDPEKMTGKLAENFQKAKEAGLEKYIDITNNGAPFVSGKMTQETKSGEQRTQVFKAFDQVTPGGKELASATEFLLKTNGGTESVYSKVEVVPGRERQDGGRFNDLKVSFTNTPAERQEFLDTRPAHALAASSPAPAKAAPKGGRRDLDDDIPF